MMPTPQTSGPAAPLPMHFVRAPQGKPTRRNPNGAPDTALQIVARHGPLTVMELEDRVAEHFKGYPLDFDVLMRSLTVTRVVRIQADLACITMHGTKRLELVNDHLGQLVDAGGCRPARTRVAPEGGAVAVMPPIVPGIDAGQLTGGKRNLSSAADNRAQPMRPGADNGLGLPSRMGEQLHYRNGVVTDLAGNVLQAARKGEVVYRPTHSGQDRARPVYTA